MNYFRSTRNSKIFLGLLTMLVAVLASTYAANITINGRNSIEFGQAIYNVQACQSWIQISFNTGGWDNEQSDFPITGVNLDGLDPNQCAGSTISINVIGGPGGEGNSSLNLYTDNSSNSPVSVLNFAIDSNSQIVLLDSQGNPEYTTDVNGQVTSSPQTDDGNLNYRIDAGTRGLTINFDTHLAFMGSVNAVTLQTGSLPQQAR